MTDHGSKLLGWLRKNRPDIVTLQKTGPEEHFPTRELCDIGYESKLLCKRSPSDLGVGILSHSSLPQPEVLVCQLPGAMQREESRFLTVKIGKLWVSSVYAPYGSKPLTSEEAIKRRVAWLNRLRQHVYDCSYAHQDSLLCGDFNVKVKADGPPKGDRYSEQEQNVLEELMSLGFCDLYRRAHPNPEEKPGCTRGYSEKCPNGQSRLHLVLASESLKRRLRSSCVDVDSNPRPRKDAPPLVVDFADASL